MQRAVRRGLARREREVVPHLGVDEKSFQRRHEYVTVVNDLQGQRVLFVADDRKQEETVLPLWEYRSAGAAGACSGSGTSGRPTRA